MTHLLVAAKNLKAQIVKENRERCEMDSERYTDLEVAEEHIEVVIAYLTENP